ncbi:MAG TPA: hypothetical protein DDW49_02490 [Deltaproteobacteria bacterium]|nr:hypothetical protein [Deltaproteobacteria bacterium]
MENKTTKIIKDVYVISETNKDGPDRWTKIGVAFVNRDESINVILDSVPLSGKLHIRSRKSKKQND